MSNPTYVEIPRSAVPGTLVWVDDSHNPTQNFHARSWGAYPGHAEDRMYKRVVDRTVFPHVVTYYRAALDSGGSCD